MGQFPSLGECHRTLQSCGFSSPACRLSITRPPWPAFTLQFLLTRILLKFIPRPPWGVSRFSLKLFHIIKEECEVCKLEREAIYFASKLPQSRCHLPLFVTWTPEAYHQHIIKWKKMQTSQIANICVILEQQILFPKPTFRLAERIF